MRKEIIICAAVRFNGKVWRGHRHADAMSVMHDELSYTMTRKQMIKKEVNKDQGFITSNNRYVDRREAFRIACKAGQVEKRKDVLVQFLTSEDLY